MRLPVPKVNGASLRALATRTQREFMVADLARSGLTAEDVPAWEPYTAKQITEFVNADDFTDKKGGYHIPQWDIGGHTLAGRVRRATQNKKLRYAQPAASQNHWYLTPCKNGDKPWREVAENVEIELWFVEGEKKAERVRKALANHGVDHVRVVAVTGVPCYAGPEFDVFKLAGRVTRFLMDSDCAANTTAAAQVKDLLSAFEQRGARVVFCPTPQLPGSKNTGADDYLQSGDLEADYIKYVQSCTVTSGTRPAHVDLNAAPTSTNPILERALGGLPVAALYGRAGECARQLMTAPLSFSYLSLLAHAAPLVRVANSYGRYVRNVLFVIACGDVADGKSQAREQALAKVREYLGASLVDNMTPGSDRGLYEMFCPPKPKPPKSEEEKAEQHAAAEARRAEVSGRPRVYPNTNKHICLPSYCLSIDEGRTLMNKAAIEDSSLLQVFNNLFDYSSAGFAVRGTVRRFDKMDLSLFMCLTVKDPMDFREVFGVASAHGFHDRSLLAVCSRKERDAYVFMPSKQGLEQWPQTWQFSSPDLPAEIWHLSKDWIQRAPSPETRRRRHRLREIGIRVAYVLAAMNGDDQVGGKVWKCVEALLEWQEALRAIYVHAVGTDKQTECTNVVLDYFNNVPGHAASWREASINQHWHRKFGATTLGSVKRGLEISGVLAYDKASKKHYLTHLDPTDDAAATSAASKSLRKGATA